MKENKPHIDLETRSENLLYDFQGEKRANFKGNIPVISFDTAGDTDITVITTWINGKILKQETVKREDISKLADKYEDTYKPYNKYNNPFPRLSRSAIKIRFAKWREQDKELIELFNKFKYERK